MFEKVGFLSKMEAFDMAACLNNKLLDFGSNVGEEDEETNKKLSKLNSSSPPLNPNRSFPVSFFFLLPETTSFWSNGN